MSKIILIAILLLCSRLALATGEFKAVQIKDCTIHQCVEIIADRAETLADRMFISFNEATIKIHFKDEHKNFEFHTSSGYADFQSRFIVLQGLKNVPIKKLRINLI